MRLLLLLTVPLALGSVGAPLAAQQAAVTRPFAVAELFFELNDTDDDLGIHASVDGGTWTSLDVKGPLHPLLAIVSNGRLKSQGLTQLAFESAEPTFEELHPNHFFRRFPL